MTKIKRCFLVLLATIMTCSATAAAAQASESSVQAIPSGYIDDTFTIGSSYRGPDRTFSANRLYVRAIITNTSGNAVSNSVTISLNDYNGNAVLWSVPADGNIYGKTFQIVSGRVYYFNYVRVGEARNLKLRIIIDPYTA